MKKHICISQPCGFEGNHRLFLIVLNDEKRTVTTYDKKTGKQVYHRPHNIPFNIEKIYEEYENDPNIVMCPRFIMPMRFKYRA